MRYFVMTAAAATLTTLVLAGEASAVQDTPMNINGVEAVCTGVGSAKDNPAWKDYPVKVVVATSGGADLANVHMTLSQGGKEVAGLDCDAPWVLFKAPAGKYTATATLIGGSGASHSASFTSSGGAQKEVTIMFPRPAPTAQ